MKLPEKFLTEFKVLMTADEFVEFVASFDCERTYGIRVNTLKISCKEFEKIAPFDIFKVPWTRDGYYISSSAHPGLHPYYHAGLYYIQDPSAMFPGKVVEAKAGERILDLCAAPGGKSIQVASGLKERGILVSNDVSNGRISSLMKNIELYGVRNSVITNDYPKDLLKCFPIYFDKILVDAPCSGEGMFRKDTKEVSSWESYKSDKCVSIQKEILECSYGMLKAGGTIVYSTCTYNPNENERVVEWFLGKFPDTSLVNIEKVAGMESGRTEWTKNNTDMSGTARMWPHKLKGEGHFTAKIIKSGILEKNTFSDTFEFECTDELKPFSDFLDCRPKIKSLLNGKIVYRNGNVHLVDSSLKLSGLKVKKTGWYLGEIKHSKFIPSQAFLMGLFGSDFGDVINYPVDDISVQKYLKGETLISEGEKGIVPISVDGYLLGWGNRVGSTVKNMYPKGWTKVREY